MATVVSATGATRPAPKWWRNLERGLLLILIPAATVILQSWGFDNEMLSLKINLIVNTGLTAIIKFIGMMLVDTEDNYLSNLPEHVQENIEVNVPPVEKKTS